MRKIHVILASFILLLGITTTLSIVAPAPFVYAEKGISCKDPYPETFTDRTTGNQMCCPRGSGGSSEGCIFAKYVNPVIALLAAIAAIAVVGGLTYGGILYGSSGGDSGKITKAKSVISRSLVGLVAFLLLGGAVQFLTPGGNVIGSKAAPGTLVDPEECRKQRFLGIKSWYAYLPDDAFSTNNTLPACSLSEDAKFFPGPSESVTGKKQEVGILPGVALAVVDGLLRIAAIVAVVFVIVGGVKYMTSQGNPDQVKQALSSIINALIGLAIAMVAAAVVSFIGSRLGG